MQAEFRFKKENLHDLVDALQLEEEQLLYNRLKVDAVKAVCVLLKRFAYPCPFLPVTADAGSIVPPLQTPKVLSAITAKLC